MDSFGTTCTDIDETEKCFDSSYLLRGFEKHMSTLSTFEGSIIDTDTRNRILSNRANSIFRDMSEAISALPNFGWNNPPRITVVGLLETLYCDRNNELTKWIYNTLSSAFHAKIMFLVNKDKWDIILEGLKLSLQYIVSHIGCGEVRQLDTEVSLAGLGFSISCYDGAVYIAVTNTSGMNYVDIHIDGIMYKNCEGSRGV